MERIELFTPNVDWNMRKIDVAVRPENGQRFELAVLNQWTCLRCPTVDIQTHAEQHSTYWTMYCMQICQEARDEQEESGETLSARNQKMPDWPVCYLWIAP